MAVPVIAGLIARKGITAAVKKYGRKAVQGALRAKKAADSGAARVGSKKAIKTAKETAKPTDKRLKSVRGKSKSATTRRANANRKANEQAMSAAKKANVRSGYKRIGAGTAATIGVGAAALGSKSDKKTTAKKTTDKKTTAKKTAAFGSGSSKTITRNGKKLANVNKEQLKKSGLTLRGYMNAWNKTGKRPTGKKATPKPKAAPKAASKPKSKSKYGNLGKKTTPKPKSKSKYGNLGKR